MIELGMVGKEELLNKLEEKFKETEKKLIKRRLDMADQDSPNVSRYITATRWLVEQEIESLDKEFGRLKNGLTEIKKIVDDKNRFCDGYFVSDDFEYLELGIISKKTEKGRKILEANTKND